MKKQEDDRDDYNLFDNFFIGFVVGFFLVVLLLSIFEPNGASDIGLSQEAGDLICQKLTNNTDAYAIDWSNRQSQPIDSLICEIRHERIDGGLIQIKN